MITKDEMNKWAIQLGITADDLTNANSLESAKILIKKKRIFLQVQVAKKLSHLANEIEPKCLGDMENDCAYLCKITLLRQMNHYNSLIILSENFNSDINLIARSIFEGILYFFYLAKDPLKIRQWRLYSVVEVYKSVLEAEKSGDKVPSDLKEFVAPYLDEINKVFLNKKGKYSQSWARGKTIETMSKEVDKFEDIYLNYYRPLSNYHHWGNSSLGWHFQITDDGNNVIPVESSVTLDMIMKSLDLANSSMLSILEASIDIFDQKYYLSQIVAMKQDLLKIPFARMV